MSIFGAMQSGISALASQSSSMGAISDNIANVNTVGYKSNSVAFSTLVTKQSSSSLYSPGGVQSKPKQSISAQGLLSATSNSTDVAISGSGYFVVNQAANPGEGDLWAYTRAGSFSVDENGYLKNRRLLCTGLVAVALGRQSECDGCRRQRHQVYESLLRCLRQHRLHQ